MEAVVNYCTGPGGCGSWKKIIAFFLCRECYDNWFARRQH
jgi:hypothetical protein